MVENFSQPKKAIAIKAMQEKEIFVFFMRNQIKLNLIVSWILKINDSI